MPLIDGSGLFKIYYSGLMPADLVQRGLFGHEGATADLDSGNQGRSFRQ